MVASSVVVVVAKVIVAKVVMVVVVVVVAKVVVTEFKTSTYGLFNFSFIHARTYERTHTLCISYVSYISWFRLLVLRASVRAYVRACTRSNHSEKELPPPSPPSSSLARSFQPVVL